MHFNTQMRNGGSGGATYTIRRRAAEKRLREHIVIHTHRHQKTQKMSEYVHRGAYTPISSTSNQNASLFSTILTKRKMSMP